MSRTPASFTQADIARALRAIEQTGGRMALKLAKGEIHIIPLDCMPPPDPEKPHLDNDEVIPL